VADVSDLTDFSPLWLAWAQVMSAVEVAQDSVDGEESRHRLSAADILCGGGLALGIIAAYVFIALTPSLLAHHGVLLEALAGTNAAIVRGGAFARVGRASLLLVVVAPLCTIALYDVFYWWAGRRWGNAIAAFYTKNNPRAGRWLDRAERIVRRRGIWAMVLSQYLPLPNVVIYLSCGTSGMPLWMFVLGDIIGMLLWEALLVGLGWAIGHPAVHIVDEIGHYSTRVTIGVVVILIIVAAVRGRRQRRSSPSAEPLETPVD
jgi:membrane-associated protein